MDDNTDDVVASFLEELLTPLEGDCEDSSLAKSEPVLEKKATECLVGSATERQSVNVSNDVEGSQSASLDTLDKIEIVTDFVEPPRFNERDAELMSPVLSPEPEISRQEIFLSKFSEAGTGEFKVITFGFGRAAALAIPLALVGRVMTWPEKIHRLPGQRSWLIGSVFDNSASSYMLIDTHSLLFSSKAECSSVELTRVLVLNDNKWALAVGSVGEIVSLKEQDVDWRTGLRRNAWSIGVIKDSMTSLLNSEELIKFAISKS